MDKIGWGQFALTLALSRVLSEAAAVPETTLEYGMQRFTVIIVSFLLTLTAYIPICLMTRCARGKGFIAAASNGSPFAARVIAALLCAGLFISMTETFTRLDIYAASTIFDAAPAALILAVIALICLYALGKGVQTAARVGALTAAGYLLLMILTIIALIPFIRLERMYLALAERPDSFIREVIAEFSRNSEILIFAALYGRVRSHAARSVFVYVGISCAALLLMTFLYNTVLGEYLGNVNFPFYALASLSDVSIFSRLNGIDVMIWVMAASVRITLLALSIREALREGFKSARLSRVISAMSVVLSAAGAFMLVSDAGIFGELLSLLSTGIPLLALAVPLPIIALCLAALGRRKERFTE